MQKIWTHFKRTPATHKLGVLYVVDSVVREWIGKANASGQEIGKGANAQDGTYAAGVSRITDLLPQFMNDLIATAPEDQREKIVKLVGIWDRGNTFPKQMLAGFEAKLAAQKPRQPEPPAQQPAAPGPSPIDILSALQKDAKPGSQPAQTGAAANPFAFPQPQAQPLPQPLNGGGMQPAPGYISLQNQAPVSVPAVPVAPAPSAMSNEGLQALYNILPPSAMADPTKLQKYLQVLQQLIGMGVPTQQWKDVIMALEQQSQQNEQPAVQPPQAAVPVPYRQERRDRSRSPGARDGGNYNRRERSPPRRGRPAPSGASVRTLYTDANLPPDNIRVMSRTLFVGGTQCPEYELREIFARFGDVQSVICNNNKRHAFVKMCTRNESVRAKDAMETSTDPDISSRARSVKWGVGFGPRECCDYTTGISVIPIPRLTDADRRWILTAEYGGTGGLPITGGQVMEEPDIEIGAGVSSKAISLKVGASAQNENRRGGGGDRGDRGGRGGGRHFNGGRGGQHQANFQQPQFNQQQVPQPMGGRGGAGFQQESGNPNFSRIRRRDEEPNLGAAPPAVPGFGFQLPAGLAQLGQPPFGR